MTAQAFKDPLVHLYYLFPKFVLPKVTRLNELSPNDSLNYIYVKSMHLGIDVKRYL